MPVINVEPGPLREWRLLIRLGQIDPDQSAGLLDRVGFLLEAFLEPWIVDVRRLHHGTVMGKFPAMIDAADAGLFHTAEEQRGATVTAGLIQDPNPSVGVAKRDEMLPEEFEMPRFRIRLGQIR